MRTTKKLECLSSGSLKKCYKKDQNSVYLIPFNKTGMDDLEKEMSYLNFLKEFGIPVVEVRGKIQYQGRQGIQEQMLTGNTLVKPHLPETFLKVSKVEGIEDQIRHIRTQLERNMLLVEDLQFMVNRKQKLVLMDPLRVIQLFPEDKQWLDVLEKNKSSRLFNKKMVEFKQQLEDLDTCIRVMDSNKTSLPPRVKTTTKKRTKAVSSEKKTTASKRTKR